MAKQKKTRKVHEVGAKRSSGKKQMPLPVLEMFLKRLHNVVKRRGGKTPS